jgi:putative spermidine/putrescine transport system substrate-binding protein
MKIESYRDIHRGGTDVSTKMMAAASIIAVLAVTPVAAQERSSATLKVGAFGGAFTAAQKKYVGDIFTQTTGIKVQYVDGPASDLIAKLIASKGREPPFDVVYLEKDVRDDVMDLKLFAKLDSKIVTNLEFLYDEAKNPDGFGPGMAFYSVGIAYNKEKFAAAGIPAPTSWRDLWNPKLAGRVAIPDLVTSYGREFLVAATQLQGGNESSAEKGVKYISEIKAHSYFQASAPVAAQFVSGDVWAAPWINAQTWRLIDRGVPLGYVIPTERGIGNVDTIDMAANTKMPQEAQLYINMVLGPLAQMGNATDNPLGPTNKLLAPILNHYPEIAKRFPSSPEDLKKLYLVDWPAYQPHREELVQLWNRIVTSK